MKTIEATKATEAVESINALPVHDWVDINAYQFDEADEDFAGEIHVDITPRYRAHGMEEEHELHCARVAAQHAIKALSCVAGLVSLGWVSSEGGVGESFRVALK